MSRDGQDLSTLVFFVFLIGAMLSLTVFNLYRMIASGESWLEDGYHRRSERPADYWIDVVYHAFIVCVLGAMAFTIAMGRHGGFEMGPLVVMAVVALMAARALAAKFVNGDNRHFRRTWWAARYWSFVLLMSAVVAFFLLVPKTV